MAAARPWTRTEAVGCIAGLALFMLLQQGYLTGPIAVPGPYGNIKGFLDAQFWIFTTSHAEQGLTVTRGLPVWRVAADGALSVHNSHPPTVALLEYLATFVCGATLTAVRLPALLFSTAMVGCVYLLLRRAFPPLAAALACVGLAMQPMFFHLATCPEVFLLGHLPLLALLYVGLFGFAPPPPPPMPPEPEAFPPEDSYRAELLSRTQKIEAAERISRRRRRIALAVGSAAAVAVSYPALGVIVLWAAAWWALRRTRHSGFEALAAVLGAVAMLGVLLAWLHFAGGSVAHWAERGMLRAFGAQHDRPDLATVPDAVGGWGALLQLQWTRLFQAEGFLAWLGLIGVGLCGVYLWRPAAQDPAGRAVQAQRGLLLGLVLLLAVEGLGLKQNAWTHVYTVSAAGFLTAFGLAVIGEHAVLGFQQIGLARAAAAPAGLKQLKIPYVMGIILSLTALGAIYRLSEVIDAEQTGAVKSDLAPLVASIAAARQANPGRVLVYDGWLLPARTVTGEEVQPTVGYIFPYYYAGRAFLCYRQPQVGPETFRQSDRPSVVLWPMSEPFGDSDLRTTAIRGVLQDEGYTRYEVQGVMIYALHPFDLPAGARPAPAPAAGGGGAPR